MSLASPSGPGLPESRQGTADSDGGVIDPVDSVWRPGPFVPRCSR